ncbi:tol-pal system protein YbgF [Neotabrizicola shimadae]|uniref:Cell division coordinator CpoB n=1 Tax=Neotabrizicola shimadae TaxID=2807096 RepID=A0A8G0ZWR6_9RHOB|nr:tol-pal system protein YbgF [Neotabrizicola shimadae]QYZ70110.1 tol-pal system protein YbgF [Neotabrizicola shimadae]
MRAAFAPALALVLALTAVPSLAQDNSQTLADIKAELGQLSAQFDTLKSELISTGAATSGAAGGDALQRLDAIEAALARLTAQTEAVEQKVNRVVSEGSNRLGDLEFRVCELEEGCDVTKIGQAPLGGETTAPIAPAPAPAPSDTGSDAGGAELAVNEKADFDRAKEVLGQGDFRTAAELFATFAQSYPGSPLMAEAQVLRGDALTSLGETSKAARAYLEAFSGQPDGPQAAGALLKLGRSLGALGQTPEACMTLAEVGNRFPGSAQAGEAVAAAQGFGCQN